MSKILKPIVWLIGLLLFIWAIRSVELARVGQQLLDLGYGFLGVIAAYSIVTLLDTIAWKYAFHKEETQSFNLWQLWRIRQVGEAFNVITPMGTVGGEPVKAKLLKDHHGLSLKEGFSSLVIAKTTFLMALVGFLIIGTILIFNSPSVSEDFKQTSLVGLVIFTVVILSFLLFQVRGGLRTLAKWVSRFTRRKEALRFLENLDSLGHKMSEYYRENPGRFANSIFLAFLGWGVGIAELYVVFYFLGQEMSFTSLWAIEALSQLVRMGSFFIPMGIGALESGSIVIFMAMGLTADLGLTVTFVRRIKELLWVGLGLAMGWGMAFKPAEIQPDPSESS